MVLVITTYATQADQDDGDPPSGGFNIEEEGSPVTGIIPQID